MPRKQKPPIPVEDSTIDTASRMGMRLKAIQKTHPTINPGNNKPYGITAEQRLTLIQALTAGNFRSTACQMAGISENVFLDWMRRGGDTDLESKYVEEHPVEPYKSFVEDVKTAEAESEARLLANIQAHGQVDWRANAWIMSRKFKDRWGDDKTPVQIGTSGNVSIMLPSNTREKVED